MFARTERLLLRPGWGEDAAALHSAIADTAIIRNLLNVPDPYTTEDARAFLANDWDPKQPKFLIFSRTRAAPRLVGGCGIHQETDGQLSLGYWISRPFWGLGFATEAASAVMRMARATALGTIGAGHVVDNHASGRVLAKIGFRPTGRTEKRYSVGRQRDVDVLLFEDSGVAPMRGDPAAELYEDRAPVAA